ncbi:poly(A)-specific ribonuclease [Recurvomyces mirabilis]|uniref:PAN2-PAN3 deadenylation complex catalytic subunit PAN2 n=1 Tax=Recurvomyces mirabilis TaxID=574656 RepID=A0AAE0WVG7_9PEZI|nr:poly(A)-specific ribonuclease [Recurvomyces mirabilis]KAK5156656.1 poly(A)-specific ribonuclease [Recurvomyces mirabilis]
MEADWNEIARINPPGPSPNSPSSPVTTFAFDTDQELLWTGNEYGRVTSFYGLELQRYTSWRAHISSSPRGAPGNAPVKQFLLYDKGVISLSTRSVHCSARRGLAQWHIVLPDMVDLRCMSFTGKLSSTSEIVVAGCQQQMYRIDVEKGTVTETMKPAAMVPYTMMRRANNYICAASHDGSIHLLDPNTLAVVQKWQAYAGTVNDMDARGDHLLTCGWAHQQYGGLGLERLVRVFDLKRLRPAAPISFQQGAAYVRMHPKLSSTCIVLSEHGAINSIDVLNQDVPVMRFANTFEAQLTGLQIMPSGKGFAMSDTHCQIVLWGSQSKVQYTEYSRPTEFPDPVMQSKHLDWAADLPSNLIGMPYYREALLSGWPNSLVHEVGAPPVRLDQAILTALRKSDYGMVGPNPRKTKRYEVEDTRASQRVQDALAAPRFLSEKPRGDNGDGEPERRLSEDIGKVLSNLSMNGSSKADMLAYYRPVEIKYSKFGVDDFDFRYFNKTKYSGLETHIVNSYANPLLQLFRFTSTVRNLALRHTAKDCRYESCLLCELGFLIDMLEKAEGQNCQATNLLKALSKQPGAATLAILEDHTINTPLTIMLQNLNRFLLERLEDCVRKVTFSTSELQAALGTRGSAFSRCTHCGYEDAKEQSWYSHDLMYPPKPTKHSPRPVRYAFTRLLQDSVHRYDQQRGYCNRCQGYKAITSRRVVHAMPAVLMINAAIHTPEARQLWATPGFLPQEVGIINANSQFYCYEGPDLQHHLQRRNHPITVYELVGFVADVAAGEAQKPHLVSIVDAGISSPDPSRTGDWHLVNDFLVRPIAQEEALVFDPRWKLPSVLAYQTKHRSHEIDNLWKGSIDKSILYRSLAQPAFDPSYEFKTLSDADPLPGVQTHCAIDAEFVRLLREEIDMGADGSRTITRPARSGLARVSVLRGNEPNAGVPFVDDYIAVEEPVDDYLTQYSGLHAGDLTAGVSQYTLVPLKEVYKKLWVLLNLGCTFIGHGLTSDFRTINIHVPEEQVIDTQDLFSLGYRSQRKLSLRFLAWLLLHEDIQQNAIAGHDSIEDARTAYKLWRKYLEYVGEDMLEDVIDDIWRKGRPLGFQVPASMEKDGRRLPMGPETPRSSAPGTPSRTPATMARTTPGRLESGNPLPLK